MTREDYEKRRRAFEEQLRADVALLHAAHEARLRSLDRLWQEELERETSPAVRETLSPSPPPAPKPARPRYSVVQDLEDALARLPEVFDRRDVIRALGYKPAPTTLLRALDWLREDGVIKVETSSLGGAANRYRKLGSPD